MTSSNGNIFCVTGPLWGESIGHPVDSPHKGQWCGALMFYLMQAWTTWQLNKQSRCWRFETPWRSLWHHCNEHDRHMDRDHVKFILVLSTLSSVDVDTHTSLVYPHIFKKSTTATDLQIIFSYLIYLTPKAKSLDWANSHFLFTSTIGLGDNTSTLVE